ncbi:DUF421 domain-containing protein [Planococcus lenghuensis]|uniref:DUF421 domain-containing protein n=1 Tax=Planococcus lenghuensis TaxID=2213202 RepID=A0A1Q2L1Y4_9BACL|nr:YetF domain-containing protein [Planococcus lenghuensis]AQQ54470.1 hypothetical protein B0X71_16090 [Planococcus lenghuensis]
MFEITMQSATRILTVGTLAYIGLVVFLLISGKRTLSKLNAFDFIITIALGSTLATILLSSSVSLPEGLLALALLVFLQFAVTFTASRVDWFSKLIKEEPQLLYLEGNFLRGSMKKARVEEVEILQSIRSQGIGSLDEVSAVVLETDGSMSIIKKTAGNTLSNVEKPSI